MKEALEELTPPENVALQSMEYPDGGLRAWLTVFGAFMVNFSCYGMIGSYGVFQEYYSSTILKDHPPGNISWIGSIQMCLVLLVGCFSGPLFDAGYLKILLGSGEFYQFILAQGLGVGLSMGLIYAPALSTIPHHFQKRKIQAIGIFASGASVGGVVLPIALRRLFNEVGFGWGVRILAFIIMVCVTTGFLCCSTRLPPRKGSRVLDFSVFKELSYSFLVFGAAVIGFGLFAPISYGVSYAVAHGVSTDLAFYSLSVLNAGSFFGRLAPNFVAPHLGPINVLMACCTVAALMDYLWITAKSTASIMVFNAFFGFASGAYVSILPAAIASLSVEARDIGVRLGMAFFTSSFFWLASSPIQGALIRLHGSYMPASIFAGTSVITGVGLMAISRHLTAKRTGKLSV